MIFNIGSKKSSEVSHENGTVKQALDNIISTISELVTSINSKAPLLKNVGANNRGIYLDANGIAQPMAYQLNKTVPSNAVFTDTNTWRNIIVEEHSMGTLAFQSKGSQSYTINPNTKAGYTLVCAYGLCWNGHIACTHFSSNVIAFINLESYAINADCSYRTVWIQNN